jgi:hypothetical protein
LWFAFFDVERLPNRPSSYRELIILRRADAFIRCHAIARKSGRGAA